LNWSLLNVVKPQERVYVLNLKKRAGAGAQHFEGVGDGRRLPVSAAAGERVEAVGDSYETGKERNAVTYETVRIPAAVQALMVTANRSQDASTANDGRQDPLADDRMFANERLFGSVESSSPC
jgi:hypothetical protein